VHSRVDLTVDLSPGPNKMLWKGVSWVMLADVIGTGILSFNQVAAQLGWLPLFLCLIIFALLSIFSAMLMSKTFVILKEHFIEVKSMGEAAFHLLGGRGAYIFVTIVVYGYAFLGNATYLLVLAQNIQGVVYDLNVGILVAVVIASVFLLPFLIFLKHISESTWLCFANLLLLIGVLALGMGVIVYRGKPDDSVTELYASTLTVNSFFQASTAVLYAYAGHWMYFELISSMEKPQDFVKVVWVNTPIQFIFYAITAGLTYAYIGKHAGINGIIHEMPNGVASRIANTLLFLHVAVVYIIKSLVLISFTQTVLLAPTWVGRRVHWRVRQIGLAILLLVSNSILVVAIPYFYQFLGLIGGIFAAPISYLFPFLFYLAARGRYANLVPSCEVQEDAPLWRSDALTYVEIVGFCTLYVFVLSVSVSGTYAQILDIIRLSRG
jgi:amino acid permease